MEATDGRRLPAFNRGDAEALDSIFAGEPAFQWYSSPAPGRRFRRASMRRRTLVPYFEARHADNDRMRLRRFSFSGRFSDNSGFGFAVNRRADSFRDGKWFVAQSKGAVICTDGEAQIFVMSLGGVPPKR